MKQGEKKQIEKAPITYADYLLRAGYKEKQIKKIINGGYEWVDTRTQLKVKEAARTI